MEIHPVLERIERGEITVDQALRELRGPKSGERLGGFPLWLRIGVAEGGGKYLRIRLPLFLIGPLFLALVFVSLAILLTLGLVLLALLLVLQPKAGKLLRRGLVFVVPACLVLVRLSFTGRGAGVELMDGEHAVVVRLE